MDIFYAVYSAFAHLTLAALLWGIVFFGFAPSALDRLVSWFYIKRLWGDRCSEYQPGCHCCEEWALYDWLFNDGPHPDDLAKERDE